MKRSPKNLQYLHGSGTLQTRGTVTAGGGATTPQQKPSFPYETNRRLTDVSVTKPMSRISTRCIMYIFGNQYYLLDK